MADERTIKKLDPEELGNVAGGLTITHPASDPTVTRARAELAAKENAASVSGMGLEKRSAFMQGGMGGQTVRAFCPVCKKETEFRVYSGARSICSVCGNIRLDM